MSEQDETPGNGEAPTEEPFFLTVLPFAGLFLLLVLAVVWRVLPERDNASAGPGAGSGDNALVNAIESWTDASEVAISVDPERDFVKGRADAPVTIVEFSDFECPYCREAAFGVEKILKQYEGDVRVVFKNLPLDQSCNEAMAQPLHHFACRAAELARCAGAERDELFWSVHDMLFTGATLSAERLDGVPEEAGLDPDALATCLASGDQMSEVREDIALARELGISGTPVFFLNGRRLSDYRLPALESVLQHVLSRI